MLITWICVLINEGTGEDYNTAFFNLDLYAYGSFDRPSANTNRQFSTCIQ